MTGIEYLVIYVIMIAATIASIALAPKPPKPKPASLADFQAPTAEQGRPIPVIFGTINVTGPNVIWYGDLGTEPVYSDGGKK